MFSKPKVQHGMRGGKTNTALHARQLRRRAAESSKSHDHPRQGRDPRRRRLQPRCVHDGTRQQLRSILYVQRFNGLKVHVGMYIQGI